MTSAADNATVP